MNLLEVDALQKDYGDFRALNGVSFVVPEGQIIGLLGPNGAGKTTTIHILLGIISASGGSVKYFGKDFSAHRQECLQRINFASSFNTLQGRISVWENLLVFAALYGVKHPEKKIKELLEYFEISHLMGERFWNLSAGQRTRANLVKSLLNDPAIILMDEPTASLDPDIADKTLTLIEELNKSKGLSILYTSHNMDEVTRICERVIFLEHGKVVANDTPVELTKRIGGKAELRLTFSGTKKKVEAILTEEGQDFEFPHDYSVVIRMKEKDMPAVIAMLHGKGIKITDIEINKATLEDVFLTVARKTNHVH